MRQPLFIAGIAILAGCQNQQQFEPGKWATEVTMSAGQSQLWSSKVERCIDPAASGDDMVTGILSATPLGRCQKVEAQYGGQTASVRAHCMGRPDPMFGGMPQSRVHMQGRYSKTSIDGDLSAQLDHQQPAGALTGKLSARRTGDCSA